ncbi:MAG: universal stress protein [Pseudomonadota bacterium]
MNKNKILVALDGSEKAFKTIQYLCSFKPFLKKEIVLHNIITKVPACFYDLQKDPLNTNANFDVKAWEIDYRSKMDEFMAKSKQMLVEAGFKPEAITVIVAGRNRGVARDIMDEAQNGYHSLLIRRRGGAKVLLPLAMGSVSTKLVEKTAWIPVMLAGVQIINHVLLIAVDGSAGSKRAVDFVAKMVEGSDCRIVLCSVLRDFDLCAGKNSDIYIRSAFEEIERIVMDAVNVLETYGIQRTNIITKIVQGAKSRAGAIVDAAREENCDTIVLGRKGHSNVNDFDIGRVPWKVIHGARELTAWLVP